MGNQISSQEGVNNGKINFPYKDKENEKEFSNKGHTKLEKFAMEVDRKDSIGGFLKDNSSYKGVKTDIDTSNKSMNSRDDKESTNEVTEISFNGNDKIDGTDIKDQKVPTLFEWKEEGGENVVYLTGSFCNWNQKFLMKKDNYKFELNLVIRLFNY